MDNKDDHILRRVVRRVMLRESYVREIFWTPEDKLVYIKVAYWALEAILDDSIEDKVDHVLRRVNGEEMANLEDSKVQAAISYVYDSFNGLKDAIKE